MVNFLINSEDLRVAITEIIPFIITERTKLITNGDYYDLDRTNIQIHVESDDMCACISFGNDVYKISSNLHCDSDGDISFSISAEELYAIISRVDCDLEVYFDEYRDSKYIVELHEEPTNKLIGSLFATAIKSNYFSSPKETIQAQFKKLSGDFIADALAQFAKISTHSTGLDYSDYVWFDIDNATCDITATNNHCLKHKRIDIDADASGRFDILSYIANPIADFVRSKNVILTSYQHSCVLCASGTFIEFIQNHTIRPRPNITKVLRSFKNNRDVIFYKKDILNFISAVHDKFRSSHFMYIHVLGEYTFLHNTDNEQNLCESAFIRNYTNCSDIMFRLQIGMLENMLANIDDELVTISYDASKQNSIFSVSGIGEPYSFNNAQLMAGALLEDDITQIEQNEAFLKSEIFKTDPRYQIKTETFEIGSVFNRYKLPTDNADCLIPVITSYGVDVTIVLNNLSIAENKAFNSAPITVALYQTDTIPFVILNFNDIFQQQFALNVMSMDKSDRHIWLSDDERNLFRLFLVEATSHKLVAIRLFPSKIMGEIKQICAKQATLNSTTINNYIVKTEQFLSVREMFDYATMRETIESPEINI